MQANAFEVTYYRNNRNSNQKNLRCFPTCAEKHIEKHFCGCPLYTTLTMTRRASSSLRIEDVRLIGEFAIADLLDHRDVVLTPNNRIFEGKIEDIYPDLQQGNMVVSSCRVVFNSERRGWHYSWVGSRFTSTKNHVFSVQLHVPALPMQIRRSLGDREQPKMRLAQIFNSPSFTIASLRRKGVRPAGSTSPESSTHGCRPISYAHFGENSSVVGSIELTGVSSKGTDGSGHGLAGLLPRSGPDSHHRAIVYDSDFLRGASASNLSLSFRFVEVDSELPLPKRFRPSEELFVDISPSKF